MVTDETALVVDDQEDQPRATSIGDDHRSVAVCASLGVDIVSNSRADSVAISPWRGAGRQFAHRLCRVSLVEI